MMKMSMIGTNYSNSRTTILQLMFSHVLVDATCVSVVVNIVE